MPTWLLFLAPCFIWGTTWLVIKFQLGAVAPEVSVAYRFGLAALILFAWCALRRVPLRFDARTHVALAALGVMQYAVNYVLVYRSETHLTSGLVAVVFVLVVPWNLVGSRVIFGAAVPRAVAGGAALGMAGVTLVFWPEVARLRGTSEQLHGVLLGVLATLAAAASNLGAQRIYARGVPVVPSTAWSMAYGAASVALWCAARGDRFAYGASLAYTASLAYLAVFGSVFAFVAYLTLLKRIGAGRAGYTAAVIPVLAMATSTVFEEYRWTALAVAGMLLVLAGNVLVLRGRQREGHA